MKYYNWYNQCPYFGQYSRFNYPAAQSPYSYFEEFEQDEMDTAVEIEDSMDRAQRDIERVIGIAEQTLANEINQVVASGMNRNVVLYFIREIVTFMDRNYDKYNYSLSNDITSASDDIKYQYYWMFNIMRIFGVPFEQQVRLLDYTVRLAFQNLRPGSSTQGQSAR